MSGTRKTARSDGLFDLLGYDKSEPIDYALVNAKIHHPDDVERITRWLDDCLASGGDELSPNEYRGIRKDGRILFVRTVGVIQRGSGNEPKVFATVQDITEQERSEARHQKLQVQLTQAQKMESVGRLAGGVAHDFNNMLSVILGYTDLAMSKAAVNDPLLGELKEIRNAAGRSIEITRQLLAFARRQTIRPQTLDVNESVEGMLNMLQRLIGEDIELSWRPGADLWPVNMDPSQIDQILANLMVNARDALSDVGKITIETGNVHVDETSCMEHSDLIPGDFALLAVTDDGRGMDKETLDSIFEPFFTTKEIGKGTGLGLSTVYGIVKQNHGFIHVYSEPDKGTTFRVYLPRHTGELRSGPKEDAEEPPRGRGETVLVVEDELSILNVVEKMLDGLGYRVLEATTPAQALARAEEHRGEIRLLVTDVIMPGMNGWDLADRLQAMDPRLKVLFMSGYTAEVIAHQGVLEKGVHFLQKPFSMRDLAVSVRHVLEA